MKEKYIKPTVEVYDLQPCVPLNTSNGKIKVTGNVVDGYYDGEKEGGEAD